MSQDIAIIETHPAWAFIETRYSWNLSESSLRCRVGGKCFQSLSSMHSFGMICLKGLSASFMTGQKLLL
jgi:hypothetical protein